MRLLILLFCGGVFAAAQSHPGWWTFADPDSKSIVGIKWSELQDSPQDAGEVAAIRARFAAGGELALPPLACLMNSHDFLIASPPLLIGSDMGCHEADVRAQAAAAGMKHAVHKGIELWIAPGAGDLSLAQWTNRVVLIGARKDLMDAIDRSQEENRTYSPLLMTAAAESRSLNVWIAGDGAVGDLFDPVAAKPQGTGTRAPATVVAPPLSSEPPKVIVTKVEAPKVEPVTPVIAKVEAAKIEPAKIEPAKAEPAKAEPGKAEPTKDEPYVIRIYGLEGGTKEIVLPKKNQQ